MRLMASERGAEQPLEKYARFKDNIQLWYEEMEKAGLNENEVKMLEGHLKISYGICESQERLMALVQEPMVGGHSLAYADKLRKAIAKKKPKEFLECEAEFFKKMKEDKLSKNLCEYVWNNLFKLQKGYSFNLAHCLSYSLIGLQELNLAFKYPIIFWNTANLIVDSSGLEDDTNNELEEVDTEDAYEDGCFDMFDDDEDDEEDDDPEVIKEMGFQKKKAVAKTIDYGKVSIAIGRFQKENIEVSLPDINKSSFTFTPVVEENKILFGIRGISKIGLPLVRMIIENRPYFNLQDFCSKVKISKDRVVNLIKSGAFDSLEKKPRDKIMSEYMLSIADQKKEINLRNMSMLIGLNLIPEELDFYRRLFNFNKYLKKSKFENYYNLDSLAYNFYASNYDIDLLTIDQTNDNIARINQKTWDKIYDLGMNPMRTYLKSNQREVLDKLNSSLVDEQRSKYAYGTISSWEMDSISFYYHKHPLSEVHESLYNIRDFNLLNPDGDIDYIKKDKKTGAEYPLFKLCRIAGTVLDRNKMKHTVTLLTQYGVVTVKVYGDTFITYDKQISEKGIDGKKKIIEKSWFSRGNNLLITGVRRGDNFIPKKYQRSQYNNVIELITNINSDGTLGLRSSRVGEDTP